MLSSILNSERAIEINIAIVRAFVKLRHAVLAHQGIARRVEKLEGKVSVFDTDIRLITQDLSDLKKDRSHVQKPVKGSRKIDSNQTSIVYPGKIVTIDKIANSCTVGVNMLILGR